MASSGNAMVKSANCGDLEIIRIVSTPAEARALPPGAVVGDLHGGVTFSDAIAEILERRSVHGWREVAIEQASWTVIHLNR